MLTIGEYKWGISECSLEYSLLQLFRRFENVQINKEDVYAFSVKVIDKHRINLKTIIRHIYDCGAKCVNSFSEANVVVSDTKSLKHYKQTYESETVKVITYKQLKEMTKLFEKQK